jgi:DNA (cytosine-5)-methyltransferase 1
MTYLDGFSGYGGFHLGFEQAGWHFDKVYYSEIDKHAIANYTHNFPNSIYAGAIDTICHRGEIDRLDLFTFGWPCQDNSIAGKRRGQQPGTRSGLLYSAVEIIAKYKPRIFVAENVAGLLTVNRGVDIVESLRVLTHLNENCPQYDIELQLFNTRWFLPQNRERLYFVGRLRGECAGQIFPFGKECSLSDKEWLDTASCVSALTATDAKGPSRQRSNLVVPVIIGSVIGFNGKQTYRPMADETSPCLTVRARGGPKPPIITDGYWMRRLMPVEHERLQGLPDGWTQYGNYNGIIKKISDTQRYRLTANGVSIPVVRQIAELLKKKCVSVN